MLESRRVNVIELELNVGSVGNERMQFFDILIEDRVQEGMDAEIALGVVHRKRREHDPHRRHKVLVDAERKMKIRRLDVPERFGFYYKVG